MAEKLLSQKLLLSSRSQQIGKFVMSAMNYFLYSDDGKYWYNSPSSATNVPKTYSCAGGKKVFFTAAGIASPYAGTLYASENGIDWIPVVPSGTANGNQTQALVFKDTMYVASGYHRTSSKDGKNWSSWAIWPDSIHITSYWYGSFTCGDNKVIFCPDNNRTNKVAVSSDFANWSTATVSPAASLIGGTYGNGKFLICEASNSNKIYYSSDGVSWSAAVLPATTYWKYAAYGNKMFIVISNSGPMAKSTDGINWTSIAAPTQYPGKISYAKDRFFLVPNGNTPEVWSSYDGTNWQKSTLPVTATFSAVAFG